MRHNYSLPARCEHRGAGQRHLHAALVACLLLFFAALSSADDQPTADQKIRLDSFSICPAAFSPMLGQKALLTAELSARYTDGLGEQGVQQNFRFFVRTAYRFHRHETLAAEFSRDTDLVAPPSQPSQQWFSTTVTFDWNGRDAAAELMPDGAYTIECHAELWREKLPKAGASPNSGGQLKLIGAASAKTVGISLDSTPPVISSLIPADGGVIAYRLPEMCASYSDTGAGVSAQSVAVEFNGRNVTALATISASGFSFVPERALSDGRHTVRVSAGDLLGNRAEATWSFTVVSAVAPIAAASGAVVQVTDPQSPIFGACLFVPPGAVLADTFFWIRHVTSTITMPAGHEGVGPCVAFGPATDFLTPAVVYVPYTESLVNATGTPEKAAEMFRSRTNPAASEEIPYPGVDTTQNLAFALILSLQPPSGQTDEEFQDAVPIVDPDQTTVAAAPLTLIADGVSTASITIVPKDGTGQLLGAYHDVQVLLEGGGTLGEVKDLGNGTYRATFVAARIAGVSTIAVSVNNAVIPATVTVTQMPTVRKAAPAGAEVGQAITIIGKGFDTALASNTVEFTAAGGGTCCAMPTHVDEANGSMIVEVPHGAATGPLRVVVDGLATQPIGFVIAEAGRFTKAGGDCQVGLVGSTLPERFATRLVDTAGNPIEGWDVEYKVSQGSGAFDDPPAPIDAPQVAPPSTDSPAPETPLAPLAQPPLAMDRSFVDATGKEFRVTTPSGRAITLQSAEEVHIFLEASDRMISYVIESPLERGVPAEGGDVVCPTSTLITLSGLDPSSTLHKFEDSYRNEIVVNVNPEGSYTYTQDLTKRHHVFYQPTTGTIFVGENGPSQPVGIWDTATKTLTLTQDVEQSIEVIADGITLNGAGHTIRGSSAGYGIYVSSRRAVTVRGCRVENFSVGSAIYLGNDCRILDNFFTGNTGGLETFRSHNNTITGNDLTSNSGSGLILYYSANNSLKRNTMAGARMNFLSFPGYVNDIDTSNTVNGRPIYYMVNVQGVTLDSSTNAAMCAFINSSNCAIRDLVLDGTVYPCVLLANTTDSVVENVIVQDGCGIGIGLFYGANRNRIERNSIKSRGEGIYAERVRENFIQGNTFRGDYWALFMVDSGLNTILGNSMEGMGAGGVYTARCTDTIIEENIVRNGYHGVTDYDGANNLFEANTIEGNSGYGMLLVRNRQASRITGNTMRTNGYGLYLLGAGSETTIVWQNNIYGNLWSNVDSFAAIQLSWQGQGNYWGHTEPPGFYVFGGPNTPYDSNRADVVDSFPYLAENGWLQVTTVVVKTDANGIATAPPFCLGDVAEINLIEATALGTDLAPLTFTATSVATPEEVPGPAMSIAILAPATVQAGSPFGLSVVMKDPNNNTAVGFDGILLMDVSDARSPFADPAFRLEPEDHGVLAISDFVMFTAGVQTVLVCVFGDPGVQGMAFIEVLPGPPTQVHMVGPTALTVGGTTNLTFQLTDDYGNPISGTTVEIVQNGQILGTVTTGWDGTAQVQAPEQDAEGTSTLNFGFGPSQVAFDMPVATHPTTMQNITISTSKDVTIVHSVAVGRKAPLTLGVEVKDEYGRPVPGIPLNYQVVEGSGFCDEGNGHCHLTDYNGFASMVYIAGDSPGHARVRVTAPGYPGATTVEFSFQVAWPQFAQYPPTWQPGAVWEVPFEGHWNVCVVGPNGESLEGEKVVFSATDGAIICSPETWTDANGMATVGVVCMGSQPGTVHAVLPDYPAVQDFTVQTACTTAETGGTLVANTCPYPACPYVPTGGLCPVHNTSTPIEANSVVVTGKNQHAPVGVPFEDAIVVNANSVLEQTVGVLTAAGFTVPAASRHISILLSGGGHVEFAESATSETWNTYATSSSGTLSRYAKPSMKGPHVLHVTVHSSAVGHKTVTPLGGGDPVTIAGYSSSDWRGYYLVYGGEIILVSMAFDYDRVTLSAATLRDHTEEGQPNKDGLADVPEWEIGKGEKGLYSGWTKNGLVAPVLIPKGEQLEFKAKFKGSDAGITGSYNLKVAAEGWPFGELTGTVTLNGTQAVETMIVTPLAIDALGVYKPTWTWKYKTAQQDWDQATPGPAVKQLILVSNQAPLGEPYVFVAWWACEWCAASNWLVGGQPVTEPTDQQIVDRLFEMMKKTFRDFWFPADAVPWYPTSGPGVNLNYQFPWDKGITNPPAGTFDTRELLQYGQGACGHWAAFFDDLCKVHGVTMKRERARLVPIEQPKGKHLFRTDENMCDIDGHTGTCAGRWGPFFDHMWCNYEGTKIYDTSFGLATDGAHQWPGHGLREAHFRRVFSQHMIEWIDAGTWTGWKNRNIVLFGAFTPVWYTKVPWDEGPVPAPNLLNYDSIEYTSWE